MVSNILEIKRLTVEYKVPEGVIKALDKIDLYVKKGEILAIVGESGSGKTTLAHSIARLLPKNARIVEGSIIFHTRKGPVDLTKISEEEMRKIRGSMIGMVFQDPMTYLNPVMKISDQIIEGLISHKKISKKDAEAKTLDLLKKLRIPNPEYVAKSYPHQLSGGMKQRVIIAMAMINQPDLLIADEPTSALDVTVQAEILELFKELRKEYGVTIIIITHDLGVAVRIADRIVIMYAGKIMEIGDVREVFKQPLHPYTQGLLGSILSISENVRKGFILKGAPPDIFNPTRGCKFHPRCPFVMRDICINEDPPLFHVGNERYVACWLYRGVSS
ncbi:MAG: ATP-binding cassette domain-containing protein [Desulfurococcales archaeon]|nr:ATP-binding cassette domain-containing protein [Desulfurococcales archaeon]